MQLLGNDLHNGDVILCNHPSAGGSHLPDLTVITPVSPLSLSSSLHSSFTTMINACSNLSIVQVFYKGQSRLVFYVACRGHHADIGGATPGSMPPHSKYTCGRRGLTGVKSLVEMTPSFKRIIHVVIILL